MPGAVGDGRAESFCETYTRVVAGGRGLPIKRQLLFTLYALLIRNTIRRYDRNGGLCT